MGFTLSDAWDRELLKELSCQKLKLFSVKSEIKRLPTYII